MRNGLAAGRKIGQRPSIRPRIGGGRTWGDKTAAYEDYTRELMRHSASADTDSRALKDRIQADTTWSKQSRLSWGN